MLDNINDCTKILLLKFTDQKAKLFTSLFMSVETKSLIEAKFRLGNIRMKHVDLNK